MSGASLVKVTLIKSPIGRKSSHKATLKALGLRKVRQTKCLLASPEVIGMLTKVSYMIIVEAIPYES